MLGVRASASSSTTYGGTDDVGAGELDQVVEGAGVCCPDVG